MADTDHAEELNEDSGQRRENEEKSQTRQKPRVCRRLDFDADHEKQLSNLMSLSDEELERHRQRAIEKWNFDFENEVPLDGNWLWEKVSVQLPEAREVIYKLEKEHHENRAV